jgi:peptide/nickel transport system ATP-binding protein
LGEPPPPLYKRPDRRRPPSATRHRTAAPLGGDAPSARELPSGCRFHPRCPLATAERREREPALRTLKPGHLAACHHA